MRKDMMKQRVIRACDTCRIKKTKCDGRKPCSKCVSDNQVCTFTQKRKETERVYTPEYVNLIETKLKVALATLTALISEIGSGHDGSAYIRSPRESVSVVIERLQASGQYAELLGPEISKKDIQRIDSDMHSVEAPQSPQRLEPERRRGRPPAHHTHTQIQAHAQAAAQAQAHSPLLGDDFQPMSLTSPPPLGGSLASGVDSPPLEINDFTINPFALNTHNSHSTNHSTNTNSALRKSWLPDDFTLDPVSISLTPPMLDSQLSEFGESAFFYPGMPSRLGESTAW